jgi:hypothetical protein
MHSIHHGGDRGFAGGAILAPQLDPHRRTHDGFLATQPIPPRASRWTIPDRIDRALDSVTQSVKHKESAD